MKMSESEEVDVRLKSPFTALVVGATGSGKTTVIFSLIEIATEVATPPPVEIIYCYSVYQDVFSKYTNLVRFHEGMINIQDENEIPKDGQNRWIIIDDLMEELGGKKETNSLFTKFSHHLNISVFFLVQNLFAGGNRTVSINSHYFFLFKNPRDSSTITNLAKQIFPGNTSRMMLAYQQATSRPHSFLLVDLKQETPENARLIGNFASDAYNMEVYV